MTIKDELKEVIANELTDRYEWCCKEDTVFAKFLHCPFCNNENPNICTGDCDDKKYFEKLLDILD